VANLTVERWKTWFDERFWRLGLLKCSQLGIRKYNYFDFWRSDVIPSTEEGKDNSPACLSFAMLTQVS